MKIDDATLPTVVLDEAKQSASQNGRTSKLDDAEPRANKSRRAKKSRRFLSRLSRKVAREREKAHSRLDAFLVRRARRSGLLSQLYYLLWSPAFRREQQAFLVGRSRYARELVRPGETVALLRRNVHRIEKGILMRPRRRSFALGYIEETVDCYARALKISEGPCLESGERKWVHDVLSLYFSVVDSKGKIKRLRERFAALENGQSENDVCFVPYQRDLHEASPVSYEALWKLARRRRSVRWFIPKPVPRDLIDLAVQLGTQAPSACNRQPFQFRVFDDPDLVRRIARIPMGTGGYAENIPVITVVIGQQRHYFDERDRHLIYIDASLAVMGMVYALETLGLSTCCINWPDIEEREREMSAVLKLDPDERPIMCLAIGYPDPEGMVAYSQKKSLDVIRRYNFE